MNIIIARTHGGNNEQIYIKRRSRILKSSGTVPDIRFRRPIYPIWEAIFFLFEGEIFIALQPEGAPFEIWNRKRRNPRIRVWQ